jgi:hypothetical protein
MYKMITGLNKNVVMYQLFRVLQQIIQKIVYKEEIFCHTIFEAF